jgi:hypothetical protein
MAEHEDMSGGVMKVTCGGEEISPICAAICKTLYDMEPAPPPETALISLMCVAGQIVARLEEAGNEFDLDSLQQVLIKHLEIERRIRRASAQ